MNKINKTLILCAMAVLLHSLVFADKIIVTDKINDEEYNYLKITVEPDYVSTKQFATKDEPAQLTKTYKWLSEIVPNSCSNNCGTGTSSISTKCIERLGVSSKAVDNSICVTNIGEHTETTPSCTDWSGCGAQYSYSTWGTCKPEGKMYRTATCVDIDDEPIPDEACAQINKEELNATCVSLPATCNDIRINNPSSPSGFYLLYPDGVTSYNIYCDMITDGGGWMQIMVTTSSPKALMSSPTTASPGYLNTTIMKKFASIASQILIKDHTGQYVVSLPETRPIQALRNSGRTLIYGNNHQDWTSPTGIATQKRFEKTCQEPGDAYPNWILWACGNTSGVHVRSTHLIWTHTGGGSYTGIISIR